MSNVAPLTAKFLSGLPGIRHGFFTREGGVSTGIYAGLNCGLGSNDDPARVLENRRRAAAHLNARAEGVITLYQEHGATALTVTGPIARDALPKADAVVSTTPGLVIGVLTADCTPVLFADAEARVVAAAHAGWRGAVSGILERTIEEMLRQGAERARIRAAVGPTISQAAYEVGPDFEAEVTDLDSASRPFFSKPIQGGKSHFDLPGYATARLTKMGLADVENLAVCTHAGESLFFSFRRTTQRKEPDYGRQISAIVVT